LDLSSDVFNGIPPDLLGGAALDVLNGQPLNVLNRASLGVLDRVSRDVLNRWRSGQPIDAKFTATGSAHAASGEARADVSYKFGHLYSGGRGSLSYAGTGDFALADLRERAETTENYGIGFYEKPAALPGFGNPRPFAPSNQYSTPASSTQGGPNWADPSPPDPEGRLFEHHTLEMSKYFGPGYHYSQTRFGAGSYLPTSRIDLTVSGGISFTDQYRIESYGGFANLKYSWW
jgi:hypothetical protein